MIHDHRQSLCVALDSSDRQWISRTAEQLSDRVGWLKLGLEAFTAFGPPLVRELARGGPRLFLDLKLHDIPTTVARAAINCAASGATMFNVHASGGRAMLEAAVRATRASGSGCKIIAVTLLTSLGADDLRDMKFSGSAEEVVVNMARLSQDCGVDGVVASAREAAVIRERCGRDFLIVTPGIRPAWSASDDQQRVVTPAAARTAGADILVVGRPIARATDPAAAADRVVAEMANCERRTD